MSDTESQDGWSTTVTVLIKQFPLICVLLGFILVILAAANGITEVYRQSNLPPGETGGGMVDVLTSRPSAQAASAPAGARRPACRPVRRSDFRAIAGVRAGGPTPRKSRARPARISPAVRVPGDRHGAGLARPGTRAGSV